MPRDRPLGAGLDGHAPQRHRGPLAGWGACAPSHRQATGLGAIEAAVHLDAHVAHPLQVAAAIGTHAGADELP